MERKGKILMDEEIKACLGLPFVFSGYQYPFAEAKVVFFGVPLDATTSFRPGARYGPNAIREASLQIETFDIGKRADFFEKTKIHDIGDIWVSPGNLEKTLERIEKVCTRLKELGKIPFMLGGEHTITAGASAAFQNDKPLVIHFDAHADLRDDYSGDKLCHATVLRRILDWLAAEDLVQLGVRSVSKEEFDFIRDKKIRTVFIDELRKNFQKIKKELAEKTKNKKTYITIDIDVLDPSIAPGAGTLEPNGLSYPELTGLIESISGEVIGLDLVETTKDEPTASVAAKIVYEILCQDFFGNAQKEEKEKK